MNEHLKLSQILILPFDKAWKFFLANLIVSLLIITFFFTGSYNSISSFLLSLLWSLAICMTQWSGHVYIHFLIDRKISILKHPTKHTIWNLVFKILYAMTAYVIVQALMKSLIDGLVSLDFIITLIKGAYFPTFIAMGISLTFSARGYFFAWRKGVLEMEQLKTEMLSYKYESLRNQINPHFLFNSFNVLTDLIYSDQKQAVDFVQKMSDLFRYVLDSRDKELVPLSEEVKFIDSYISLLKTRFEDKLEVDNQLYAEDDDLIVPMGVQLLLENAVKHNEVSRSNPLHIRISRNKDGVEVWNNVKLKNIGDISKKMGLKNIQQQYKFFTDQEISIKTNDASFGVTLPILKADQV